MRRIALAGVITTAGIIATGAAVRLSESGLGCPDWPQCTRSSLVAAHSRGDPMFHTWIEFGNRMVTVAITLIAVVVFIAAWRFRPGGHRRRDLVWLAAVQPVGILAQAVLGGIVVLTKLNPAAVALHFLASIAVLAAAVVLHVRCTEGTGRPGRWSGPTCGCWPTPSGGRRGPDAGRRDRGDRDRAAGRRGRGAPVPPAAGRA